MQEEIKTIMEEIKAKEKILKERQEALNKSQLVLDDVKLLIDSKEMDAFTFLSKVLKLKRENPNIELIPQPGDFYEDQHPWTTTAVQSYKLKEGNSGGLICFQNYIYVCNFFRSSVTIYNPHGDILKELSLKSPFGIDVDTVNCLVYAADQTHVHILTLKLENISSWKLPATSYISRGIKLDNKKIYLTIPGIHQIFVCQSEDGKVLIKHGGLAEKPSNNKGEYNTPRGLSANSKYLYICDEYNHRVQIVSKEKGNYINQYGSGKPSTEHGQFTNPYSIYIQGEEVLYVGDSFSVQMFTKEGKCIQRLGDKVTGNNMKQFNYVYGMCILNDRLYVSDGWNQRIQVFKRNPKTSSVSS